MTRFIVAGGEKFNKQNIRAVAASEAQNLEYAQALIGRQDARTT